MSATETRSSASVYAQVGSRVAQEDASAVSDEINSYALDPNGIEHPEDVSGVAAPIGVPRPKTADQTRISRLLVEFHNCMAHHGISVGEGRAGRIVRRLADRYGIETTARLLRDFAPPTPLDHADLTYLDVVDPITDLGVQRHRLSGRKYPKHVDVLDN